MKNYRLIQRWIITSITFGVFWVGLGGGLAFAVDGKMYSGYMCNSNSPRSTGYDTRGGVYNTSPQGPLTVRCPIVRDNMGNSNGLKMVKVWYKDNHSSATLTCSVNSFHTSWPPKVAKKLGALIMGSAYGKEQATFSFFGPSESTNFSYYFLECSLPANTTGGSLIYAYYVEDY